MKRNLLSVPDGRFPVRHGGRESLVVLYVGVDLVNQCGGFVDSQYRDADLTCLEVDVRIFLS